MPTHDDDGPVAANEYGFARGWAWHHAGLVVDDLDRAIGFYREALGYEVEFEVRGMGDQFQRTVGVAGVICDLAQLRSPLSSTRLELLQVHNVPDGCPAHLPVHVGIGHGAYQVRDLLASLDALIAAGGTPVGEIVEFAEGPAVYCWTPAGTVIELEQASSEQAELEQASLEKAPWS